MKEKRCFNSHKMEHLTKENIVYLDGTPTWGCLTPITTPTDTKKQKFDEEPENMIRL